MDRKNGNESMITPLPYEVQLHIFCEMTDMDSARSLTLAYPQCRAIFLQNQARITKAVCLNKARQIVKYCIGVDSLEIAKIGILAICDSAPLQAPSSWMLNYLVNEKMPPNIDPSALEEQLHAFEQLLIKCQCCVYSFDIVHKRNLHLTRSALRQILHVDRLDHPKERDSSPITQDEVYFMLFTAIAFREPCCCLSMSGLMEFREFANYCAKNTILDDDEFDSEGGPCWGCWAIPFRERVMSFTTYGMELGTPQFA
ncbi:hypothetical protein GGR58DRAFT_506563 [Xylaria digitata]|nr:hypothetical protein GGR58DRAFT_506563 [Xylaria digitata]